MDGVTDFGTTSAKRCYERKEGPGPGPDEGWIMDVWTHCCPIPVSRTQPTSTSSLTFPFNSLHPPHCYTLSSTSSYPILPSLLTKPIHEFPLTHLTCFA
ncbi:hypothetical protein VNO78_23097 [Psophocarpus tetragonolobus]|uniref:Uncharacterized protein n=1 Tax=Psophocarpus tetragonolobus TaxID=3891 RepID=A0AAN9S2Y4_PSOTE